MCNKLGFSLPWVSGCSWCIREYCRHSVFPLSTLLLRPPGNNLRIGHLTGKVRSLDSWLTVWNAQGCWEIKCKACVWVCGKTSVALNCLPWVLEKEDLQAFRNRARRLYAVITLHNVPWIETYQAPEAPMVATSPHPTTPPCTQKSSKKESYGCMGGWGGKYAGFSTLRCRDALRCQWLTPPHILP